MAKAFKGLDSVTITTDEITDIEANEYRAIADDSIATIKQYWTETASKRNA